MKTAVEQLGIAFRQWQKEWDNFEETRKNKPKSFDEFIKPFLELEKQQIIDAYDDGNYAYGMGISEAEQETLEEAGEKLYPNRESFLYRFQNIERLAFTEGAKWQSERMYSEEEARAIWSAGQEYWRTSGDSITFEELTETFKNK